MKSIIFFLFLISLNAQAQSPANQKSPEWQQFSDSFRAMHQKFQEGFKDFHQKFEDGFSKFRTDFAEMNKKFRQMNEAFREMNRKFKEGFSHFDNSPEMSTDTGLTNEERVKAIKIFEKTNLDVLNELKGLTKEQLNYQPAPGKWSIAYIAEHIALAEIGLYSVIQQQLQQPADAAKHDSVLVTDDDIYKRLTNRSGKATSPEVIKPTGRFADIQQTIAAFTQARAKNIEYINNTKDALRTHYWIHPATGLIDLYQTLLLIAAHSERHVLQIREVKASAGFPK